VEDKPRETVVIFVSPEEVTIQGESVVLVADILAASGQNIGPIGDRLERVKASLIGAAETAESLEVTILVDRSVPFRVVKRVMSTCTSRGYGRISLAGLQKSEETHVAQG
jgi:biopolymer transport protein ExbD